MCLLKNKSDLSCFVYSVYRIFVSTNRNNTMKKVKTLRYNWRQVGSTIDRDGAGDDCERFTVGENGVFQITEHAAVGEGDKWYYDVEMESSTSFRIFNPNIVEYFPED